MGAYSVAPFILHAYILRVAQRYGFSAWLYEQALIVAIVVVLCAAMGITIGCAWLGQKLPWLVNFSQLTRFICSSVRLTARR